jgi:hypothetical protein
MNPSHQYDGKNRNDFDPVRYHKEIFHGFQSAKEGPQCGAKKDCSPRAMPKEMESALTAGKIPTPPHTKHSALSQTKIFSISIPSTASHATYAQKFNTHLNLPPTHEDTPAKMSSSPMADVGTWNLIYYCVPPIASGYRGSRKNATREEYFPPTNQLKNRNAPCKINSNIGRTTRVATNLKSYFFPFDPSYMNKDPNGNWGQDCMAKGMNLPMTIIFSLGGFQSCSQIPRTIGSIQYWHQVIQKTHSPIGFSTNFRDP